MKQWLTITFARIETGQKLLNYLNYQKVDKWKII